MSTDSLKKNYVIKVNRSELNEKILELIKLGPVGVSENDETFDFYYSSIPDDFIQNSEFKCESFNPEFVYPARKIVCIHPRLRIRVINNVKEARLLLRKTRLNIIRGSAFGTGEHVTTRRLLHLISRLNLKYNTALDFGAGSGILGLAFEKLFRGSVYFVENDELALENLRLNLKLNSSKGKIVSIGDIDKIDVIFANVYFSTLFNNYEILRSKASKLILISGLRVSDDLEFLHQRFEIYKLITDKNWISCVAKFRL